MRPKESLVIRIQMAEMHDSVLKRIERAYQDEQYIEVCWLCYACFESRINRVLEKICVGCTKERRENGREIGIRTKLECYVRLIKNSYPPLANESIDLLNTVKGWCKERNTLIHGMVDLENYATADKKFSSLAKRGRSLVVRMYEFGTDVRNYYYTTDEVPLFPDRIIDACNLKYKCIKEQN